MQLARPSQAAREKQAQAVVDSIKKWERVMSDNDIFIRRSLSPGGRRRPEARPGAVRELRTLKYDKVVAFVDMLGFSALTEQHRVEPEVMEELQRPGAVEFLTASLEGANPLTERFIRFHLLIERAVRSARLPDDGASITFSDCAFYAADQLHSVVDYATSVMHLALKEGIPVRIGIGAGEFLVVRFKADYRMANQDHVVQFLGSGVSRAHAAEHCGLKGLRIFLHSSVHPLYTEKWYRDHLGPVKRKYFNRLELPQDERTNKAGVEYQISYIWHPNHDNSYWSAIQALATAAPEAEQAHYTATVAAVNRMRRALGRDDFNADGM